MLLSDCSLHSPAKKQSLKIMHNTACVRHLLRVRIGGTGCGGVGVCVGGQFMIDYKQCAHSENRVATATFQDLKTCLVHATCERLLDSSRTGLVARPLKGNMNVLIHFFEGKQGLWKIILM